MSQAIYSVFRDQDRWTMEVNFKQHGPYKTEHDAVRVAIETAHEAGRYNPDGAQVLLLTDKNIPHIVWTYGHDPYPPTRFE